MSISLNANEVLAIAEEVKRNGYDFYRHIEKYSTDRNTKRLLRGLALMELHQAESYARKRSELTEEQKATTHFDPDCDSWMYLRQLADSHVFDVSRDPCRTISGDWQPEEILRAAVELEKDSIIFFLELKRYVLSSDRSVKIDDMIKEEMKHIALLGNQIGLLKSNLVLSG